MASLGDGHYRGHTQACVSLRDHTTLGAPVGTPKLRFGHWQSQCPQPNVSLWALALLVPITKAYVRGPEAASHNVMRWGLLSPRISFGLGTSRASAHNQTLGDPFRSVPHRHALNGHPSFSVPTKVGITKRIKL
jgi:hypothetical protein